jgi:GNAT superfamily N-acetyltransferase
LVPIQLWNDLRKVRIPSVGYSAAQTMSTRVDALIRPAIDADITALSRLNAFVHSMHADAHPDTFTSPDPAAIASSFRAMLRSPAARVWGAELDGALVGYVLTTDRERTGTLLVHASRWLEIEQICVLPEYQRRGVGRALLDRAVADARSRGMQRIVMQSWAFNTDAHAAFQRWGFAPRLITFGYELGVDADDLAR